MAGPHRHPRLEPRKPITLTAILQTAIDAYRQEFFRELLRRDKNGIAVYTGEVYFNSSVRTRVTIPYNSVPNVFMIGRRLLWQRRVVMRLLSEDLVVLEANPRILSSWVLALLRKIMGRPTIGWAHLHSRRFQKEKVPSFRALMFRLLDGCIAYTEREAEGFRTLLPQKPIFIAPNSLYRTDSLKFDEGSIRNQLVYVGRLSEDKGPILAIQAFLAAASNLPDDVSMSLVGEGPQAAEIAERYQSEIAAGKLILRGQVSGVDEIAREYAHSFAAISADFVGLLAIQSAGFGVPLIYPTNSRLPHAPEVTVLNPSNSYASFANVASLSHAIVQAFGERQSLASRGPLISQQIARTHSVEVMVTGFERALRNEY